MRLQRTQNSDRHKSCTKKQLHRGKSFGDFETNGKKIKLHPNYSFFLVTHINIYTYTRPKRADIKGREREKKKKESSSPDEHRTDWPTHAQYRLLLDEYRVFSPVFFPSVTYTYPLYSLKLSHKGGNKESLHWTVESPFAESSFKKKKGLCAARVFGPSLAFPYIIHTRSRRISRAESSRRVSFTMCSRADAIHDDKLAEMNIFDKCSFSCSLSRQGEMHFLPLFC